ncbi:MAG TPA: twin-arginine translocase TatA/TatE family subunit [Campylobacterales bacterium]|nr:twin-arginine translocase TatA/TatE family subunit [Campylobacterales bacterium]HIP60084.1 twin-arginine translocase TatA/TatE family subunit [Campylobacterales bacterium]
MGMPSGMELVIIALVVLLLFGGKKIPELAKGLGNGIKNFKKAVKEDDDEIADATSEKIKETKEEVVKATKAEDSQKA